MIEMRLTVCTGSFVLEKGNPRVEERLSKRALYYTAVGAFCINMCTYTHPDIYTHTVQQREREREAGTNEAVYIGILFHSHGLLGERGLPITLKRQSRKSKCFYYSSSLM